MARDNGGPAFPGKWPVSYSQNPDGTDKIGYQHEKGMALRDWLAGQAVTVARDMTNPEGLLMDHEITPADVAKAAYAIADAMLAERNKP